MSSLDDASIFQQAIAIAQEVLDDITGALEMELQPLYKMNLTKFREFDLDPSSVEQLAAQAGHTPDEQSPCAACQLIAMKYGLKQ